MKISLGALDLARFTARDTRTLHRIRNHASVRPYMANPDPIPYPAHAAWVRTHLLAGDRLLLFLVRLKGRPLGFTLLRKLDARIAEIGVIFREADKHPITAALATVATLHCAFVRLRLAGLVSYVVPGHRRAIAMNRSLGAREIESDKAGMLKFSLSRGVCLQNRNYRRILARARNRSAAPRGPRRSGSRPGGRHGRRRS